MRLHVAHLFIVNSFASASLYLHSCALGTARKAIKLFFRRQSASRKLLARNGVAFHDDGGPVIAY
jgi:hypothetical protein